MGKKINEKCLACSKILRHVFYYNHPECYHPANCRRMRSWYRGLDRNRRISREKHKAKYFIRTRCFVCNSMRELECHHIEPRCRGGVDVPDNIVTLCHGCHDIITRYETKLGKCRKMAMESVK
jgi:hypothetical protein